MGDEVEPAVADVEAKATSVLLREHRMQLKARRLKKEAKAAERKVAQKKRVVEEEIRERQWAKVTIQSYFMMTRNPDNRGDLDQFQGCENDPQLRRQH
jgi:DNA helicase IV